MPGVVVAGVGHEGEVGEHAPANLHPLEAVGGQHGGHHVLREPILMQPRSLQQKFKQLLSVPSSHHIHD